MLASTPSGASCPSFKGLLVRRIQEYACDEVFCDFDYRLVNTHIVTDIKTIHAYPNCTAFTTSMAMVENACMDGQLFKCRGSFVCMFSGLQPSRS